MPSRNLFARLFRLPRVCRPQRSARPQLEHLEDRTTPTAGITLLANSYDVPSGRTELVPLSLLSPTNNPVTYNAKSSNSQVAVQVLNSGVTWDLTVTGKDANGATFNGDIKLQLFPDKAPAAVGRIVQLTNAGFYNGLTFHRVLQGFVAQGGDPKGDGTGSSALPNFNDEFSTDLTFNSPGLLALANSGSDTNNAQFFITDIGLPLATEPQFLNFRYDTFGQLVSGFDTFSRLISTPVGTNNFGETSKPLTTVTITKAQIINDPTTAVLSVSAPAGFKGTTTVNLTANDGSGPSTAAIGVNFVAPTVNNPPFLAPLANQTTYANSPVSFQIPATDVEGDTLTYVVRDPANFANPPTNVTVNLNQATGLVTVTPAANFTGTVSLLVGVRDQTARNRLPLDAKGQFDTNLITLTVLPNASSQPPVVNPISLPVVPDGTTLTFTAFATAPSPDGNPVALTYSLAAGAPTGASVNAQTGQVTWTPAQANGQGPGLYNLTVQATETNAPQLVGSATFNVLVGPSSKNQGSGLTARQTVAVGLTQSAEYYSTFIVGAYNKYLGRGPDAGGLAYWVKLMQGGLSDEHLEAGFIGSDEYIQNHGGTGAKWVTGLYTDLLGRQPGQTEVQFWVNQLGSGKAPSDVAFGFAASQERESQRVQADYQAYVGRSASATEVPFWVNVFLHGGSNEQVIGGFVGSQEFFQKNGGNVVDWLYAGYRAVLNRQPDAGGFTYWLGQLQ